MATETRPPGFPQVRRQFHLELLGNQPFNLANSQPITGKPVPSKDYLEFRRDDNLWRVG